MRFAAGASGMLYFGNEAISMVVTVADFDVTSVGSGRAATSELFIVAT
jgi:hypothetical protein